MVSAVALQKELVLTGLAVARPADRTRVETGALSELAQAMAGHAPGGLPRWRLQRALEHIEQHLGHDIRLNDLADAARLSAHHFSELFRQSTGVSPYRYVLIRRVERAKALLSDSMMGILDIALATGFSDQSHFSKVFRRIANITPSGYRAIMWQDGLPEAFSEDHTKDRANVLTSEGQSPR